MKKIIMLSLAVLWMGLVNAQKVGINTPVPDSTLTVAGSARISGNTMINGTTTTTNLNIPTGAGAGKRQQPAITPRTSIPASPFGLAMNP